MIYGKLWCVVKPTVGIPLFLSAVAISSFAVHLTLLNTAPWLKNYYVGGTKTAAAEAPASTAAAPPATSVVVATVATQAPKK
jgi:light-harvesting protein B-800-850 alpha chain